MLRALTLSLLAGLCACVERALPLAGSGVGDGGMVGDMAQGKTDIGVMMVDLKGVIVDLAKPPDLGGISCGASTCNPATQECCVSAVGTGTCVGKGTCNRDMGAALSCDGPEDCGAVANACCATISNGGGSAMCVANCPGSASMGSGGSFNATTKLCHANADCANYSGTAIGTTLPFTSCCTLPQAPGFRFCAPSLVTMFGGTCL